METRSGRRSDCPISVALEMFGDKWTLLVIRDMMFLGKTTYGEFLESPEGVATNILADRLQRLEASKIIESRTDPDNRRRTIYRLTPKGIDLIPVLLEIILWSANHDSKTAAPKRFMARLKSDRQGVADEIRKRLSAQP